MAKIGYIMVAPQYEHLEGDRKWMQDYGCTEIIEEDEAYENIRPQWKQLMTSLTSGDELVVAKFSNALRGSRELAIFLEVCRIKAIRVISIHDRIDSRDELFPETRPSDVLGDAEGAAQGGAGVAQGHEPYDKTAAETCDCTTGICGYLCRQTPAKGEDGHQYVCHRLCH